MWRTLRDASRVRARTTSHLFRRWDEDTIEVTERALVATEIEDLNLLLGAAGIRVNIAGDLLLTASLALSLSDDGLRDEDVIPLLGLDYSF